jgi:very-short-patch-repair endonuclease
LRPDEITTERGIPVTTVPRTLFDLATILRPLQLARAVNEAEIRRHTDPLSLPDLLNRYPGRAGTASIRSILAKLESGTGITREGIEDRFADFIAEHHLPEPEFNAWLQIRGTWIECDCVWRPQGVIAELDSRAIHATRASFESDRARDRALQVTGWRTVRITWHQLQSDAQEVATDLRTILRRSAL